MGALVAVVVVDDLLDLVRRHDTLNIPDVELHKKPGSCNAGDARYIPVILVAVGSLHRVKGSRGLGKLGPNDVVPCNKSLSSFVH